MASLFFFANLTGSLMTKHTFLKEDKCMAGKVLTFEDFEREQKRREFKEKIYVKIQNGKDWIIRNKETILILTPIAIKGLTTITKVVGKRSNLKKEEELKDLYCYDRSLGHYWRLRRELSNKEWLEIDQRKKNGERLADILDEMKVLK